jgi:urease subunit alpha
MLICNVVVIDAVLGIVKGDIGIKDGDRRHRQGRQPAVMDGVDPACSSAATTVRDCEGLIATAGGIDVHVHFDSAQLVRARDRLGHHHDARRLARPDHRRHRLRRRVQRRQDAAGAEHWPINFGFLGRGNSSPARPRSDRADRAGCLGLKTARGLGRDAGGDRHLPVGRRRARLPGPAAHRHAERVRFLEDTLAAIGGRTIHMYHTEGAGGGHAPDIIRVAGVPWCLPSSTNPTNPYTVNTFDEHLDMTMVCHHLNPAVPEDVAFAESRIRAQTIAAEDVLHDIGAISMLGSDSQGMGRINEVICRTWQLADKMKKQRGRLPSEKTRIGDNERIKRYIAKYTINAARTFGIAEHVGSLEDGKLADIVLWRPAFFGIKPELVIKGGFIAWGAMGDSAASLMTCEPLMLRPQWGAFGRAKQACRPASSTRSRSRRGIGRAGPAQGAAAVAGCRGSSPKRTCCTTTPARTSRVDPQTFDVMIDGKVIGPASRRRWCRSRSATCCAEPARRHATAATGHIDERLHTAIPAQPRERPSAPRASASAAPSAPARPRCSSS